MSFDQGRVFHRRLLKCPMHLPTSGLQECGRRPAERHVVLRSVRFRFCEGSENDHVPRKRRLPRGFADDGALPPPPEEARQMGADPRDPNRPLTKEYTLNHIRNLCIMCQGLFKVVSGDCIAILTYLKVVEKDTVDFLSNGIVTPLLCASCWHLPQSPCSKVSQTFRSCLWQAP